MIPWKLKIFIVFVLFFILPLQCVIASPSEEFELEWSVIVDETPYREMPWDVVATKEGIFIVGSSAFVELQPVWRVEKRDPFDGSLLWEYQNLGQYGWLSSADSDDSYLYIAGTRSIDTTYENLVCSTQKWDLKDGSRIWFVHSDPGELYGISSFDHYWDYWVSDIKVDGNDIYVVGYIYNYDTVDSFWWIEKRSVVDGNLIWNKISNPSEGNDNCISLVFDEDFIYVVGTDESQDYPSSQWRIEKRNKDDGLIVWVKTNRYSDDRDAIGGLAIDDSGLYVAGNYDEWDGYRIEKRDLTDGSIIWEKNYTYYGADLWESDSYIFEVRAVEIDNSGIYIAGRGFDLKNFDLPSYVIEKRDKSDGSLIKKIVYNTAEWGIENVITGISIDDSGIYITGLLDYDYHTTASKWRVDKIKKISEIVNININIDNFYSTNKIIGFFKRLYQPRSAIWADIEVTISHPKPIEKVYLKVNGINDPIEFEEKTDGKFIITIEGYTPLSTKDIRDITWNIFTLIAKYNRVTLAPPPWSTETPENPNIYLEKILVEFNDGTSTEFDRNDRLPTYIDAVNEMLPMWPNQGMITAAMSPVDLLVIDSQGRRLGSLYSNGEFITEMNEIPNSFYSGRDSSIEFVYLSESENNCTIDVFGVEEGDYTLLVIKYDDEAIEKEDYHGSVSRDEIQEFTVISEDNQLNISLDESDGIEVSDEEDGNGIPASTYLLTGAGLILAIIIFWIFKKKG